MTGSEDGKHKIDARWSIELAWEEKRYLHARLQLLVSMLKLNWLWCNRCICGWYKMIKKNEAEENKFFYAD